MPVSLEAVGDEPQDGPPDGPPDAPEAQEEIPDDAPQATEAPEVNTPEIPSIATGEESVQETPAPKRRGRPPKEVQEPVTPKRRGRPPKAPAAKAPAAKAPAAKRVATRVAPPPDSESSDSSSDSPSASFHRDDIETMLLSYLVQRKNTQMDKRRQMWTQLAGLS